MSRVFDGVLFDFSGTLFDDAAVLDPAALAELATRSGHTLDEPAAAEAIERTLRHANSPGGLAAHPDRDLSEAAHHRAWRCVLAEAGVGDELAALVYECLIAAESWHAYPDVSGVCERLRARGVRLGVLSNIGWDIRPACARAGILPMLDGVVLSCERGVAKPDPDAFTLACAELGVRPGRCLFVGDNPETDGAAARAGLSVYLLPHDRQVHRDRGLAAVLRLVSEAG